MVLGPVGLNSVLGLGEGLPGGDDLVAAEPGAELALLYPEQVVDYGQAGVVPHQAGLVALHQVGLASGQQGGLEGEESGHKSPSSCHHLQSLV